MVLIFLIYKISSLTGEMLPLEIGARLQAETLKEIEKNLIPKDILGLYPSLLLKSISKDISFPNIYHIRDRRISFGSGTEDEKYGTRRQTSREKEVDVEDDGVPDGNLDYELSFLMEQLFDLIENYSGKASSLRTNDRFKGYNIIMY
jgi:hypothetical protein